MAPRSPFYRWTWTGNPQPLVNNMEAEVQLLLQTLRESYGPGGRPHGVGQAGGGGGTHSRSVTSRGYIILKRFPVSSLQLKVAVGALMGTATENKDCGKFGALLALRILRSSISETTPPPSRHLQASLVHHVLREVVGYLASKDCPCRRPLDHSCVGALVNFAETVLATRSSCCWTVGSLRHVAVLTVKAFALALPSDLQHGSIRHEPLRMLAVAGQPTSESQLVEGVLVEAADIFSNDISVEAIPRRGKNGEIVTAIFTVSLAGDVGGIATEEQFTAVCLSPEPGFRGSEGFEQAELQRLRAVAETLVERGVGLVGCQKVVHPLLHQLLRRKGVVVLDRLSLQHAGSVVEVTAGEAITTHSLGFSDDSLGRLRKVSLVSFGGKSYLQLIGCGTPHHSLVLCAAMETQLDDMQDGCTAAVHLLRESLSDPVVLCGGGCTETVLANHIRQHAAVNVDKETLDLLKCSQRQYTKVSTMIAGHFEDIAASLEHHKGMTLVDGTHHHAWSLPPWEYTEPLDNAGECPSARSAAADVPPLNQFLPHTCNCGLIRAEDLPPNSVVWSSVGGTRLTSCVLPGGDTACASHIATPSPNAAVPSGPAAAVRGSLRVMDSFGAKRQTLVSVTSLLSNLIVVDDIM